MKIGDKVFIRGYVDEIRKDTVIIRNEGGYFGTSTSEIVDAVSTSDHISRQAALDAIRPLQTYKLFAGDDMILVDKAEVQTELMMLPSTQPEIVKCKKCKYVYYDEEFGNYWCNRMSGSFKVEADGYCKWGK